ncbi:hypothetical protein FIV41_11195 [Pseudomonas marginalis]|uniref:Uncharacterized protein n=1 Tax=Pseudomonas marginalis TaxID=298 RepID=A0A9X9BTA0_PSEMA|nr:hypothetical protein [Pseudomonas sp. JV449]TWR59995.1 hypothetical protein FIV41_11195 [Pseudomonas marginalis]
MRLSTSLFQKIQKPLQGSGWCSTVGASLLAKNAMAPRLFRQHALSLTIFASKLAPTGEAA